MATAFRSGTLGLIQHLYDAGTFTGLSDARLLERFVNRREEAAFAALVGRHGAMVLNTCRAVLKDPNAADDAFQATFVLLFRKGGSIRGCDALGGWLHRVAYRVAVQARSDAARRRDVEKAACASRAAETPALDDLGAVLHEEIERLPERFRLPGSPLRPRRDDPGPGRRPAALDRGCGARSIGQGARAAPAPADPPRNHPRRPARGSGSHSGEPGLDDRPRRGRRGVRGGRGTRLGGLARVGRGGFPRRRGGPAGPRGRDGGVRLPQHRRGPTARRHGLDPAGRCGGRSPRTACRLRGRSIKCQRRRSRGASSTSTAVRSPVRRSASSSSSRPPTASSMPGSTRSSGWASSRLDWG